MAHPQEEGWPLGLRLLNARIGLVRNGDFSGSVSFSTMITGSPTSSTGSSSDLDTQSTGSFFHDKSITLGSLIGIPNFLELSQRSTRERMVGPTKEKKNSKLKPWFLFSLCSKLPTDAISVREVPSLGHYLEAERKSAASTYRRNEIPDIYGPNDFSPIQDTNSLFVGGRVAALSSASLGEAGGNEPNRVLLEQGNGFGALIVFPCLCK